MEARDIRRKILETLYEHRHETMLETSEFQQKLKDKNVDLDEKTLHTEIRYLEDKGYLKLIGKHNARYLNFIGLAINSYGIDVIDPPEDAGENLLNLQLHQFGDVSNSNVSIGSPHSTQSLSIETEKLTPEIIGLLKDLKQAIENKEHSKVMRILNELSEGATAVFWNIVAGILMNLPK